MKGPQDAFVLPTRTTRPQLTATRPHGHKKGFLGPAGESVTRLLADIGL